MDTLSLKNYRVIKKIGQGGMGVVYCAEDMKLGRLVALKFLTPHLIRDPEIVRRFRAEARSQACLVHPNITLVFAFEEAGDQAFLVLEYVAGETLEDKIKRQGRLSPQETLGIFRYILLAMDYAHNKGLVHRDLKPGNVGFTEEGMVKLMDFGIALNTQEASRLTRTGHILGTPHYMAPEQILGRTVDARTDIYALGITLFETLTGRVPFAGDSDYEVSVAQINDPPPSPRALGCTEVTPALEEVLFTALAKKPEERFASCGEFLRALEDSLSPKVPGAAMGETGSQGSTEILGPRPEVIPQTFEEPGTEAVSAPPAPKRRFWSLPRLILLVISPLTLAALLIIFLGPDVSGWLTPYQSTFSKKTTPGASLPGKPKPIPRAATPPLAQTPASPKITKPQSKPGNPPATRQTHPAPASHGKGVQKQSVVLTSVPAPKKQPEIPTKKEPTADDLVKIIEKKFQEHGFSRIKVSLGKHDKIIVAGRVKDNDQKNEVIQLAKSASSAAAVDFSKLRIIKRVSPRPRKKPPAPRPTPAVPDIPRKPLPPKLD